MGNEKIYSFRGNESPEELIYVLNTGADIKQKVVVFGQIIDFLSKKSQKLGFYYGRLEYIKFFINHSIEDVKEIKYLISKIIENELFLIRNTGTDNSQSLNKELINEAKLKLGKLPSETDLWTATGRFLIQDCMLELLDYQCLAYYPPAIIIDKIKNTEIGGINYYQEQEMENPIFSKNTKNFTDIDWLNYLNMLAEDNNLYNELRSIYIPIYKKEKPWLITSVFKYFIVWIIVVIIIVLIGLAN